MGQKRAGAIVINISAGTAQFVADMERAKAKVRDFGAGTKGMAEGLKEGASEAKATSAAMKVLEGDFLNNVRAADGFVEHVLGIGPALQKAFPIIGGIAFLGILKEMGDKAYEFYKSVEEGPERMAAAWRAANAPLRATNDELALANARLEQDIAQLEGGRQNTLAIALAEARVQADKLADSLEHDLENINKLLKDQSLGALKGFFTGQASTNEDQEAFEQFSKKLAQIDEEGNASVRSAKTKEEAARAQEEWNKKALTALDQAIEKQKEELDLARALQRVHEGTGSAADKQTYYNKTSPSIRDRISLVPGQIGDIVPADQSVVINERQGALRNLQNARDAYALRTSNASLEQRKAADEADNANAKRDRPFADRINALNAQFEGVKARLAAIGKGEEAEALAKAFGDAQKAIEEVNKSLESQQPKLTAFQEAELRAVYARNASKDAETAWAAKLDATTSSITGRIQSLNMLTEAISKGYEATKRANVETSVMGAVGSKNYLDPQWMSAHKDDVAAIRSKEADQYDAQRREQVENTLESLRRQTELEKALAAVQADGAEAVRQATMAIRLKQIAQDNDAESAKRLMMAEIEKYQAERDNVSAENITRLNEGAAALQRVADAAREGPEAMRRAGLENKYSQMQRAGAKPDEITATRSVDEAANQAKITEQAQQQARAYSDALMSIEQRKEALEKIREEEGDSLQIGIALRDLENERLRILSQEVLQQGRAQDGVKAFFLDMQQSAQTAAKTIYDAMHRVLDESSTELAKMVTGQKTNFGKMFQDIGTQMLGSTIKSSLQTGLGALGKLFGIDGLGGGKPDGSSSNPYYVRMAGSGGIPALAGIPGFGGGGNGGGLFGGGSLGGTIFSALAGALIPHAAGGDVSPSSAYLVGEQGPEILMGASGRIASNSESRRMLSGGGDGATYLIDARGTDPQQTEERVKKALVQVHGSAVVNSVRTVHDMDRRMPRRN